MSSTTEGSPSSSPELATSIWKGGAITADELINLKTNNNQKLFVLLVDCRAARDFKKEQISHISCVNVPPLPSADKCRFPTKMAVVNFFYKQRRDFLKVLNAPGGYTQMIVFDDDSTPDKCSHTVVTMLTSLQKWNENTRTVTLLLDKGFSSCKDEYTDMVKTVEDLESWWTLPLYISSTFMECPLLFQPLDPNSSDNDTEEIENTSEALVIKLERVTAVTKKLLALQNSIRSLRAIKFALKQVGSDAEPDIAVPDEMQCPVCFNMFTQEIFQCYNGHCLCSTCYEDVSACPECRAFYPGCGIRNRALECVMSKLKTVDCPFSPQGCAEKFTYHEVDTHAKNCDYGVFSAVANINCLLSEEQEEMDIAGRDLQEENKKLATAEENWKHALNKWNTPLDMADKRQEYVERIFSFKANLLDFEISLLMSPISSESD